MEFIKGRVRLVISHSSVMPASRVDAGDRREGKCSYQCYFEAKCSRSGNL